ncbi:hypothetical protein PTKIN_Ptkin06aG0115700 [Pterospermum kingtungense]
MPCTLTHPNLTKSPQAASYGDSGKALAAFFEIFGEALKELSLNNVLKVTLLSRIHHRNLLQFLGYCQEDERSMLVYEFMHNGTLKEHLYVHVPRLGFNSGEISGTDVSGECFDLTSAPLSLPPFGILEAFNRNNQSQEWNVKGLGMNSDGNYKTSSELSILIGS